MHQACGRSPYEWMTFASSGCVHPWGDPTLDDDLDFDHPDVAIAFVAEAVDSLALREASTWHPESDLVSVSVTAEKPWSAALRNRCSGHGA